MLLISLTLSLRFVSSRDASSWLNLTLDLFVFVENTTLAGHMFHFLMMNVLYSCHIVGNVRVEPVLVCNDSLCVQVVAVDLCNDSLV